MIKLTRHKCSESMQGFTLLEIMVVVVLISIFSSYLVISLQGRDKNIQFENEVKRLSHVIALAREESILNSEIMGLRFRKNCYGFMLRKDNEWKAFNNRIFGPHEIPQGLEFQLFIDNVITQLPIDEAPSTPQIAIWPSGEISPFELSIKNKLLQASYLVSGSESGNIEMKKLN